MSSTEHDNPKKRKVGALMITDVPVRDERPPRTPRRPSHLSQTLSRPHTLTTASPPQPESSSALSNASSTAVPENPKKRKITALRITNVPEREEGPPPKRPRIPSITVAVHERENALAHSKHDLLLAHKARLPLWSDGSGSVAAVVYKKPEALAWVDKAWLFPQRPSRPELMEQFAVLKALELSLAEVESGARIDEVAVYTDSMSSLDRIRYHSFAIQTETPVMKRVMEMLESTAKALDEQGVRVQCSWVPGHSKDVGNERADQLASNARHQHRRALELIELPAAQTARRRSLRKLKGPDIEVVDPI